MTPPCPAVISNGHIIGGPVIAGIVGDGQEAGEVRDGDARALALYSVLINEHVLLAAEGESSGGTLTPEQFHGLIDGALRKPAR